MNVGEALKMKVELACLASKYGVASKPVIIPLSEPVDYPVTIAGLASTADVDLDRMKFRAFAFTNDFLFFEGRPLPPLLYKHDETQIAGKIESLGYDDRGNLKIGAHVTHDQAKRCGAFSVRAKINAFELVDVDTRNFHALVTNAEITEISLTDRPGNPNALVQRRFRAAPFEPFLQTMGERTDLLIRTSQTLAQMVTVIQQWSALSRADPPSVPQPRPTPVPASRRVAAAPMRRPTQFASLVQEMNRNEHRHEARS